MSDKLNLVLPFNNTSFGNLSFSIAREIYNRSLNPTIFHIGNPDASAQKQDEKFFNWIQENTARALSDHKFSHPTFRLWHIRDQYKYSNHENILTFHELDGLTKEELNICSFYNKVFLTSNYTVDVFKNSGAKHAEFLPLFFDKTHFYRKDVGYGDGRITGLLSSKTEERKSTYQAIHLWVKKFGNNRKHFLHLSIFNPFIEQNPQLKQAHQQKLAQILNGIWNVNILPYRPTNDEYNTVLNFCDYIIDASKGENWSLPSFTATALGKHSAIHVCNGTAEWSTPENSVQFFPNGMVPAYDGLFFHNQGPFNVGNWFTFSEEDFSKSLDEVVARVEKGRVNSEGLKLQEKFTVEKTVDIILNNL